MARVRFTHDFDYKPTPMSTIAYKAGMGAFMKWCIVGILGLAVRIVMLGESVGKIFAWFRPPP